MRRYTPTFLDVLKLRAAPAANAVLDAIEVLRSMNADNVRKVPTDAPTAFIKPRWAKLVLIEEGIDRRYYKLCALSELKNALRSGDDAQQQLYPYNHPEQLPITRLRKENCEWLRLEIKLPGYSVWLRIWQIQIGRVNSQSAG